MDGVSIGKFSVTITESESLRLGATRSQVWQSHLFPTQQGISYTFSLESAAHTAGCTVGCGYFLRQPSTNPCLIRMKVVPILSAVFKFLVIHLKIGDKKESLRFIISMILYVHSNKRLDGKIKVKVKSSLYITSFLQLDCLCNVINKNLTIYCFARDAAAGDLTLRYIRNGYQALNHSAPSLVFNGHRLFKSKKFFE